MEQDSFVIWLQLMFVLGFITFFTMIPFIVDKFNL